MSRSIKMVTQWIIVRGSALRLVSHLQNKMECLQSTVTMACAYNSTHLQILSNAVCSTQESTSFGILSMLGPGRERTWKIVTVNHTLQRAAANVRNGKSITTLVTQADHRQQKHFEKCPKSLSQMMRIDSDHYCTIPSPDAIMFVPGILCCAFLFEC